MSQTLLLFVFPIVTIIFAIALEKLLGSPLLTAGTIFGAFLIATFTVYTIDFLIYAVAYGILAFVVAYLYRFITSILSRLGGIGQNNNGNNNNKNNNNNGGITDNTSVNPNTRACRVCNCQRQYCRCMRRI